MLSARRFPPPWTVEETAPCFIVRDAKQQVLAFVLLRGRARKADDGQAAHPQRGAADRGQYRQLSPLKCRQLRDIGGDPPGFVFGQ